MIKIENTEVFGFNKAITSMRNPYESWNKSDSITCANCPDTEKEGLCINPMTGHICDGFIMGEADMALAKKLIKNGSEHRKFLRMIHVQADVVAPRYWWAEMDTYKWVTKNSSSTMHLITKRLLTPEDFSIDGTEVLFTNDVVEDSELILSILNKYISLYQVYNERVENDKKKKKALFRRIKQLLPEGFNQLRTIDTTYECLLNIYHQRKNHRLSEWSGENGFCKWVSSLPYMSEFISAMENKDEADT